MNNQEASLTAEEIAAKHYSRAVNGFDFNDAIAAMQEFAAQETAEIQEAFDELLKCHNTSVENFTEAGHKLLDQVAEKDKRIAELEGRLEYYQETINEKDGANYIMRLESAGMRSRIAELEQLNQTLMGLLRNWFIAEREGGIQPTESDWQSYCREHNLKSKATD